MGFILRWVVLAKIVSLGPVTKVPPSFAVPPPTTTVKDSFNHYSDLVATIFLAQECKPYSTNILL